MNEFTIIDPSHGESVSSDEKFSLGNLPKLVKVRQFLHMAPSPYGSNGVKFLTAGTDISGSMYHKEYVCLGEFSHTIRVNPPTNLIEAKIKALENELEEIQKRAEKEKQEVREVMQQLLYLPAPEQESI